MAVFITVSTHGTVSTVNKIGEVTPIIGEIKKLVIRTLEVCSLMVHTAPVFATIVWIWEPSVRRVLAVVSVATTVRTDCWFSCWFRGHAVLVTVSADWPVTTVCLLRKVAAFVDQIEQLVVRADVVGAGPMRHTVPVLPAVEGVREVASTSGLTVKNVATVLCCGPLGGGVAVPGIHTGTVATLHIKGISTPLIVDIIPEIILALIVGETTSIALKVPGASIRIRIVLEVLVSSTSGAIRQGVHTLCSP